MAEGSHPTLTTFSRVPVARALVVSTVVLVSAMVLAIGRGAVALSPGDILAALVGKLDDPKKLAILWSIRLPRVVLAAIVGAALASAGAALQGVARNPLAEPGLLGVSPGAAFGAIASIVLLGGGAWTTAIAAFVGALISTLLALGLARVDGRTSAVALLLSGVGLTALSGAGAGLLLYLADDAQLRNATFWTLGSFGGASWPVVAATLAPIALALLWLPRFAPALDRLALGEVEAHHLGVDVERTVRATVVLSALAVGAAVAACGAISFVGLLVPYLVRALLGPAHRGLLVIAPIGGAILMVLADLCARTLVAPAELPVGIVTALLGAPLLLAIIRRGAL